MGVKFSASERGKLLIEIKLELVCLRKVYSRYLRVTFLPRSVEPTQINLWYGKVRLCSRTNWKISSIFYEFNNLFVED